MEEVKENGNIMIFKAIFGTRLIFRISLLEEILERQLVTTLYKNFSGLIAKRNIVNIKKVSV